MFRSCERCAPQSIKRPITLRAAGSSVDLIAGDTTRHSAGVWLSGSVMFAAHQERVALHSPVAITTRNGILILTVTLPIETYVERVVASESSPSDNLETLKALAIVARTYALHQPHGHSDYDLCDSTHCQLLHWGEGASHAAAAQAATLATAGETLWYRGQRALAYFSKDCGGHTASPAEVWAPAKSVPYLPSRVDRNCAGGGGSDWASELTRNELATALAGRGLAARGWQNLNVERRGESGRVIALRVDNKEISAEEFRLAVGETLGWNRVPSTWFEVSRQGDRFLFHGLGWGHGVGLCQKGAAAMGAQGRGVDEILAQYFPGTDTADEATGKSWNRYAGHGFVLESLDAADAEFAQEIERARSDASSVSGLNSAEPFTVRAFPSTEAFRDATLEPGWVAAFESNNWIATQPLRTLSARRLLSATLRHEFLHALIEREAGHKTQLWLREGLAEAWGESANNGDAVQQQTPSIEIDKLVDAVAHASTQAASLSAHRAAGIYAARLLSRYGRKQVIEWLHSGVPDGVVAALGQR